VGPWIISLIGTGAATVCVLQWSLFYYESPYPRADTALSSPMASLHDFAGILMGLRRLDADIAWIQTLQYYGTPENLVAEDEEENGGGHYPLFFSYCERVARIDPHFVYVYYYGGGALGWNLKRLDEAEALLKLGIQNNPTEWRLAQYLAALSYQKDHDIDKLEKFLESFVGQPECPTLLRALLANLYKKQHRYSEATQIWLWIAGHGDASDVHRAEEQLQSLRQLQNVKTH
jgi:tetratricopeptide (TPR) repeat protein